MRLALLNPDAAPAFPDPRRALRDPEGLLAVGGSLAPEWLLAAYARGIFPWFNAEDPILWWSPDPRMVLDTGSFRLPRRQMRSFARCDWELSADRAFGEVMRACAEPRRGQDGTWITAQMLNAYERMHGLGHAHSVEVWSEGVLVGGIYGVAVGRMFFGESMFSRVSGGSKAALLGLCRILSAHGWPLLDCQVHNPHLESLGARRVPRGTFLAAIAALCAQAPNLDWGQALNACKLSGLPDAPG